MFDKKIINRKPHVTFKNLLNLWNEHKSSIIDFKWYKAFNINQFKKFIFGLNILITHT